MRASHTFALLALAGSVIAAPAGSWWARDSQDGVTVTTMTTTIFVNGPAPTTAPTTVANTPAPAPAATTAAASSNSGQSSGNDGSYISIVNEYRTKMGLNTLAQDSSLEANDLQTLEDNPGQMVHWLGPGSFAQVLAPGSADDFFSAFVGGWLCEIPTLPGLDGICATASQGWSYSDTEHAQILSNSAYSKIGCAFYDGIWGCDLA